jgi:hypothetical protein
LKETKAAKGESTGAPNQTADDEQKPSSGVLGSLGGWWGGSNKAPEGSKDEKTPESEGSQK